MADRLEGRWNVPPRQLRFDITARPLTLGQDDVPGGGWLVRDLADQVADDIEPTAHLVVGVGDPPRRPRRVSGGEHNVPGPRIVIPAAVRLEVHVRELPDLS